MRIYDENSRMVRIPDLREGMVTEPGFLHKERVTIQGTPEIVGEAQTKKRLWRPNEHTPALYRITGKLDDGTVITQEAYSGDAVWVFP